MAAKDSDLKKLFQEAWDELEMEGDEEGTLNPDRDISWEQMDGYLIDFERDDDE
jgi:hypothetical protein